MIFAGDFFQYLPIGGTPLYSPIPNTEGHHKNDIPHRLGRIAWKSLNAVISLTEQERMKEDPDYARAVGHLRTRQCTVKDLELFNTRVIKSADNPNGVDMGTVNEANSTAIVSTNLLRESINARKAHANCTRPDSPTLVTCAAQDNIVCGPCSTETIKHLLNMNMSKLTADGALPGYIPLYEGMPVILRHQNISTELCITNGSQGIVRQIDTGETPEGFTFCKSVIVEFPHCRAHFPELPPHHFPITPISWTFATKLNGELVRAIRKQLPIQPAFAVTGHSAKGKTLPSVLANLHEGGFAAYVAASRPTSRKGLCITRPVTLEMLYRPVPHDLYIESRRLEIIEHNTLVKYGFKDGAIQDVFDPETECQPSTQYKSIHPKFEVMDATPSSHKAKKRKATNDDGPVTSKRTKIHTKSPTKSSENPFNHTTTKRPAPVDDVSLKSLKPTLKKTKIQTKPESDAGSIKSPALTLKKVQIKVDHMLNDCPVKSLAPTVKKTEIPPKHVSESLPSSYSPMPGGCVWSPVNWSCAYDSFFIIFFYMHHFSSESWKTSWSTYSPIAAILHSYFQELSQAHDNNECHANFDKYRDQFRNVPSANQPSAFPRHGHAAVDVVEIFQQLDSDAEHNHVGTVRRTCSCCGLHGPLVPFYLPTTIIPTMLPCEIPLKTQFTIQDWLNVIIAAKTDDLNLDDKCHTCPTSVETTDISLGQPPYLYFDVPQEIASRVLPSAIVTFPTTESVCDQY